MREIPAELLDRPFTLAMAAPYGVTQRQLLGRRCRRLFHGVYIGAHVEVTVQVLVLAVRLVLPEGAVVSGTTAALLHGADVRKHGQLEIEVTMLRTSRIRRAGVLVSEAYLEAGDVVEVAGALATSSVRTAFDFARRRDLIERVVGIDAMLNRGGCGLEELGAYIADRPEWRGIRWAREAITHAEARAESPMESRQRMRLILGGLPRPQAQYTVRDRNGLFVARLDHGYEEWKVAPEYDGAPHDGQWREDNERQERIRDEGWWHRRYTSLSIQNGWEAMVADVRRALIERGWRAA